MKLQGTKIVLCVDNSPLALARDVSFSVDRDMVETASPSSGDAKAFTPGRYSWTMDSVHLVGNLNQNDLLDYLINKTPLDISIETRGTSSTDSMVIEGVAYLKSFQMSAPLHGFATANCSFQGTGAISNN